MTISSSPSSSSNRKTCRNFINHCFIFFDAVVLTLSLIYGLKYLNEGSQNMFTPIRLGENDHQHLIRVIQSLYSTLLGLVGITFAVIFFNQLLGDMTSVTYEKFNLSAINDIVLSKLDQVDQKDQKDEEDDEDSEDQKDEEDDEDSEDQEDEVKTKNDEDDEDEVKTKND